MYLDSRVYTAQIYIKKRRKQCFPRFQRFLFQSHAIVEQLQNQLAQYQIDEKAIKESLIESNKLALQLKNDAEKYSRVVLQRAKVFYATWQAYAKTMLNGFTVQEMEQFNQMLKKVEQLMQNYGDTGTQPSQQQPDLTNPVQKVEQATQHAIDLTELLKPDQSLEEMCNDLGLL